jgi:hypothetical protein
VDISSLIQGGYKARYDSNLYMILPTFVIPEIV